MKEIITIEMVTIIVKEMEMETETETATTMAAVDVVTDTIAMVAVGPASIEVINPMAAVLVAVVLATASVATEVVVSAVKYNKITQTVTIAVKTLINIKSSRCSSSKIKINFRI